MFKSPINHFCSAALQSLNVIFIAGSAASSIISLFVCTFVSKAQAFSTNVKFGPKMLSTAMYYANSVEGFLGAQLVLDVPPSGMSG